MQNILNFKKDYPKAQVIMLEQNYRSCAPILEVANKVIRLNPGQYEKKLWTENKKGEKVRLYEARDEVDEARFVLERIIGNRSPDQSETVVYESEQTPILDRFARWKFRSDSPILRFSELPSDLSETVILYRTHAQSRPFEEALLSAGVPYQIVGGMKFYERREIKDTVAYLRLTQNPRDLVSLERIVNVPARGIGPAAFKIIQKGLVKYAYDYRGLHKNLEELELSPKARVSAMIFFDLYIKAAEAMTVAGIWEIMNLLLLRSGYKDALLADREEGQTRWENIEELFNAATKYKDLPGDEGIKQFLEEVALMSDLDNLEETGNKLTLMTLHSAKGLEFDRVFFVGLEEGILPHARSLLHPTEIAEEIRLAYVGITRARKNLFLTYAKQRQTWGELKRSVPSRILKAIPKKMLEKLN